jgi:hypothetical protein
MKLIPHDHGIPVLYSMEDEEDPLCQLKLFTPDANWTWYVIEIDDANDVCFGYVVGMEKELGYFSIRELESIRGGLNLPVERDLNFTPKPLSEVQRLHYD